MTINFSMFSQFKSMIGFSIERNGKIIRDETIPMFQRTVEISVGFLFGYITIGFELGKAHSIEEMMKEFKDSVIDMTDKNEWK